MAKFYIVKRSKGGPIWVNIDHIVYFENQGPGVRLTLSINGEDGQPKTIDCERYPEDAIPLITGEEK